MSTPVLETQQLQIGYSVLRGDAIVVASDLSLSLRGGELVCLIGPNGVGKSTLIRTLAGMQKPLSGAVTLSGQDVHRMPNEQLAKQLSVVLTERMDVGLLSGYELVALGRHPYTDWTGKLTAADEQIIRNVVQAVGAVEIAPRPIRELSDGERQKLMVARALAQEPTVMVLDEPTAFLDLPRRVEVMQLLRRLARATQQAILLSTHDLDLALRSADCIWLMGTAGAIETGAPEDLVLNGAFERVFQSEGVQFDIETGSFRLQQRAEHTVSVAGEGVSFIWTKRALERENFHVISENSQSGAPHITVAQNGIWHVQHQTFHTIYALIQYLRDYIGSEESRQMFR